MRIMLDTNVLISSIIFKRKIMTELIAAILKDHRLVLSSFVIEELKAVVKRKFEGRSAGLDHFLTVLPFEYVYTPPDEMDEGQQIGSD
ncbi:PIN domain-containing protein [Acetobacterium malicum]|uniref:PIN domain-containing protein n=1 Tax=Acetobacterium malicum TaxID=52692 RepID=A0ABR6YVU3_9FIRM|nr:PIN domain-containing protein [Acetobacterium malicum]MBC3899266.1 PIN domain-containing protein [Acetobacterium malicum]